MLNRDSPPNFKASPWRKPVHRETIGIQVYPDDKELLKQKFGWSLKDFDSKTTQTELDYQTLFDKNAYLSEYERYFGNKIKRNGKQQPIKRKEYATLPEKYKANTIIEY